MIIFILIYLFWIYDFTHIWRLKFSRGEIAIFVNTDKSFKIWNHPGALNSGRTSAKNSVLQIKKFLEHFGILLANNSKLLGLRAPITSSRPIYANIINECNVAYALCVHLDFKCRFVRTVLSTCITVDWDWELGVLSLFELLQCFTCFLYYSRLRWLVRFARTAMDQ